MVNLEPAVIGVTVGLVACIVLLVLVLVVFFAGNRPLVKGYVDYRTLWDEVQESRHKTKKVPVQERVYRSKGLYRPEDAQYGRSQFVTTTREAVYPDAEVGAVPYPDGGAAAQQWTRRDSDVLEGVDLDEYSGWAQGYSAEQDRSAGQRFGWTEDAYRDGGVRHQEFNDNMQQHHHHHDDLHQHHHHHVDTDDLAVMPYNSQPIAQPVMTSLYGPNQAAPMLPRMHTH